MKKDAIISDCGQYRYSLSRIWDESLPKVMFIMLNPSTADADKDDPTIRRCINFAKSWGYGGLYVGNLFAYRATNPKDLQKPFDPVGKENAYWLAKLSEQSEIVVCAWGNRNISDKVTHKPLQVIKKPLYYIELSVDGIPKHPLYLKKDLKPKSYESKKIGLNSY